MLEMDSRRAYLFTECCFIVSSDDSNFSFIVSPLTLGKHGIPNTEFSFRTISSSLIALFALSRRKKEYNFPSKDVNLDEGRNESI